MLEQRISSGLGGKVDRNQFTGGVCSLAKITAGRGSAGPHRCSRRIDDGSRVRFGFVDRAWLADWKGITASGHDVVFHARNAARAEDLRREAPRPPPLWSAISAPSVVRWTSPIKSMRMGLSMPSFTMQVSVMRGSQRTAEGHPDILAVNVFAPYILTAVLSRPKRLVYLSSGMHRTEPHLDDILWQTRRWNGSLAYSESKLYVTVLSFAIARYWPDVTANAVDPGWCRPEWVGRAHRTISSKAAQPKWHWPRRDSRLSGLTGEYLNALILIAFIVTGGRLHAEVSLGYARSHAMPA